MNGQKTIFIVRNTKLTRDRKVYQYRYREAIDYASKVDKVTNNLITFGSGWAKTLLDVNLSGFLGGLFSKSSLWRFGWLK